MFELTDKEYKKLAQWKKSHKSVYTGAIGGRYTYSFTPTSLGTVVKVSDAITKTEIDLSNYEEW